MAARLITSSFSMIGQFNHIIKGDKSGKNPQNVEALFDGR